MATKPKTTYQKYLLDIAALYQTRPDIKAYLELLLSIFTITLFAIFAIRPTLVTVGTLLTEINAKKGTLQELTEKANNLAIAQNLLQEQRENIDLLNKAIPSSAEPESYVRQIEGIALKDNVVITSTKTGEIPLVTPQNQTQQPSNSFEISISAKSPSYKEISDFAKDVENLLRPASPQTVSEILNEAIESKDFILNYTAIIPYSNK